jgi:hypothetical protein
VSAAQLWIALTAAEMDACCCRWLRKQAKLLAKQKLSSQQRAMLELLGVRLRVPKQLVLRTAQLQALNGTERRQLRKRWKLQDNFKHQAQRQQRQRQLQELLQQRQQQRRVEQRRERLLQQAAAAAVDQTGGVQGGQQVAGEGHVQRALVDIAVQQMRAVQQLSAQASSQQQHAQPTQQRRSTSPAHRAQQQQQQLLPQGLPKQQQQPVQLSGQPVAAVDAAVHDGQVAAVPAGSQATLQQQSSTHDAAVQPKRQLAQQQQQQQQQQERKHAVVVPTDLPVQDGLDMQEQQQQQQQQQQGRVLKAEAGALLFQPNRRCNKVKKRSRQEKWLAAADDS